MARAVAFNLRYRVAEIERDIANAELDKSNFDMLPSLDVNAARDRNSVQISNSDDRIVSTANATIAWNVLDLGVSYARAKQQADDVLIKQEQERKALQDIIRQVNAAFWRAAAGQRLLVKVHTIARDLRVAMEASREMERTKATDVISAVAFRRDIVESVKQALAIRRELQEAKAELAELLNIRPGADFKLALPAMKAGLPRLPMSVENLEIFALENRPELRVEKYNERVSNWQAREALYNLLPGLKLSAGQNYSSDSTNLSPNWISTGVSMGMNLFKLFSGSSEIEVAEGKAELARRQRLAMSLAVLTQVHMSRIKFHSTAQQMRLAHEIASSDRKLTHLASTDGQSFNMDYFETVRLATQQLRSEMDEQRAYVDLVSAHADLMHAVGLDLFPDNVPINDIEALGDAIRAMLAQWNISDGTATEPSTALPLDRLVNSMISADRRADILIAEAQPKLPAKKRPKQTVDLRADTLFTTGRFEVANSAASPPEIAKSIIPVTEKEQLPADMNEEPAPSPANVDITPKIVEQQNGAQQKEDIAQNTTERLNRIAPSSQGDPQVTLPGTTDREPSPQPLKLELPPTIGGKKDAPAAEQTIVGNSPASVDKSDAAPTEEEITQAPTEWLNRSGPSNQGSPWVKLSHVTEWEFSIQPLKSKPQSKNAGQHEAPVTSQPNPWASPNDLNKSFEVLTNPDITRTAIEQLNKIAPSSGANPPLTLSHTTDWEFSVQLVK
jgi:outer membrane protein TolC